MLFRALYIRSTMQCMFIHPCPIVQTYIQDEIETFGIDWGGPVSYEGDADHVSVPSSSFALQRDEYERLQQTISPTASSPNYGIDHYKSTVAFIEQL